MTLYYIGRERPKGAASWSRPISEVYEPSYVKPAPKREPENPEKQRKGTSFERDFLWGMGLDI